jgi:hypothetical protein
MVNDILILYICLFFSGLLTGLTLFILLIYWAITTRFKANSKIVKPSVEDNTINYPVSVTPKQVDERTYYPSSEPSKATNTPSDIELKNSEIPISIQVPFDIKEDNSQFNLEPKETKRDEKEIQSVEPEKTRTTKTIDPPTNELEINVIKSIPDANKSEPKRIGYDINEAYKQNDPYRYPVAKMPNKNCLIKFPRKGRSNKVGYTENGFLQYLVKYFNHEFQIYNDRHIPTETARPYEPDFVLINEKDNKNIFINIEIDEPYDGWLRNPTHCVGEDDLRDDFFAKRGWIVIRFAEIQIYQSPELCCLYIANVISALDKNFHNKIIGNSSLDQLDQWDSLQAKKWAAINFRESYLGGIKFSQRPNTITEYEILDSEEDIAVERDLKNNSQQETAPDANDILAKKNKHPRDKRITFDESKHRYFIDGNPDTISVTQLVNKFFPEFDSAYWAPIKAAQRNIPVSQILDEWEQIRINSAMKGTQLHKEIETHYNGVENNSNTIEFNQFLEFKRQYPTMKPFRSEWRIFDEDLLIAGTIDMVYEGKDNTLYMFDWKRSKKVVRSDGSIKNDTYQFALGPLNHLVDNSFNKYCLQQNIYKAILEKRYNQKISSMNLLVLHDSLPTYYHKQVPDMTNEVRFIFFSRGCI